MTHAWITDGTLLVGYSYCLARIVSSNFNSLPSHTPRVMLICIASIVRGATWPPMLAQRLHSCSHFLPLPSSRYRCLYSDFTGSIPTSFHYHISCLSPPPGCILVSIPAACLFAPSAHECEQLLRAFLQSYDPQDLALQRRAIRRQLRRKGEEEGNGNGSGVGQEGGEGDEAGALTEEYAQLNDGEWGPNAGFHLFCTFGTGFEAPGRRGCPLGLARECRAIIRWLIHKDEGLSSSRTDAQQEDEEGTRRGNR